MHMQTHLMAGWCVANLPRLSRRDRLLCMLVSVLPDLDGLGSIVSQNAYWEYHHKLGHNFVFGLALTLGFALFSSRRVKSGILYLAAFHLHLLLDLFGSGIGWRIHYLWPFSPVGLKSSYAWEFYSWQNISAAGLFLLWVLVIAIRHGRTPLEAIMPSLDRQLVDFLRRRDRRSQQ